MKRFALIGAAGYIAPRHMQAIRDTGNRLTVAYDVSDSVGILDSYFPDAEFFTEFETFDRFVDLERRAGRGPDFVAVASPNYLHDAHTRFGLRADADVICEKPAVLLPEELDGLLEMQRATGRKVNTVLQLRLHPAILAFREMVLASGTDRKFDVDLTYVTSRGKWYLRSWKSDEAKSGGIATNIGVHFFDMLHFVFGRLQSSIVHHRSPTRSAGYLEFDRARVRWFLSLDMDDVPPELRAQGQRTFRAISANGENIEFSDGFTDLHTASYREILAGRGFGLEENRAAIEVVTGLRTAAISTAGERHPFLKARG
jgi:UDP-N-acetyl-2-amino-2-deoxyglucuronate dehydrogenase